MPHVPLQEAPRPGPSHILAAPTQLCRLPALHAPCARAAGPDVTQRPLGLAAAHPPYGFCACLEGWEAELRRQVTHPAVADHSTPKSVGIGAVWLRVTTHPPPVPTAASLHPAPTGRRQARGVQGARAGPAALPHPSRGLPARQSTCQPSSGQDPTGSGDLPSHTAFQLGALRLTGGLRAQLWGHMAGRRA